MANVFNEEGDTELLQREAINYSDRKAKRIRKELALVFRGETVALGWKPNSATFNKHALEFLTGARAALDAEGEHGILPDMILILAAVRPVEKLFSAWIKTANEENAT